MRAAAFTELSGPDGVDVIERDDPEPDAGEAVVDVEACSINRHDLWILEGDSAMVDGEDLPFVSGLDVAGTVRAVGSEVDRVAAGDNVLLCPNKTCGTCRFCRDGPENRCENFGLFHGGLAERALVDASRLLAVPESIEATTGAAIPTAYMTAYHMLRRADSEPGDLVFVPGATGGVGVAAVQLVGALGARAIGTTTSAEKADRLRELGADHVIEASDPEAIVDAVGEIGAPDAVINHLGGAYTEAGLRVVRRGGRMVICGRTAGRTSEIDVPRLFLDHQHVIGSTMGTQEELARLVRLVADGAFAPPIYREYALEETDRAFADMRERDAFGKLVVRP